MLTKKYSMSWEHDEEKSRGFDRETQGSTVPRMRPHVAVEYDALFVGGRALAFSASTFDDQACTHKNLFLIFGGVRDGTL